MKGGGEHISDDGSVADGGRVIAKEVGGLPLCESLVDVFLGGFEDVIKRLSMHGRPRMSVPQEAGAHLRQNGHLIQPLIPPNNNLNHLLAVDLQLLTVKVFIHIFVINK